MARDSGSKIRLQILGIRELGEWIVENADGGDWPCRLTLAEKWGSKVYCKVCKVTFDSPFMAMKRCKVIPAEDVTKLDQNQSSGQESGEIAGET